jgi:hypothetical protein
MAKHGNTFFIQLSRRIFDERYAGLSVNARWLYVVLVELEHRYTADSNRDFFLRTNTELADDTGMSISTLKRAKAELLELDLVQTWQSHYIVNRETKKMSEKHYTAYRIIREWDT